MIKMDAFCQMTSRGSSDPPTIGDNSGALEHVDRLAELGRRLDDELHAGPREYVARATRLENILIEAKDIAGHGQWLPWLEEHGISDRTAQHWMRIARDPEAEVQRRLDKTAIVALLEGPDQQETAEPDLTQVDVEDTPKTRVEVKTSEATKNLPRGTPQRKSSSGSSKPSPQTLKQLFKNAKDEKKDREEQEGVYRRS